MAIYKLYEGIVYAFDSESERNADKGFTITKGQYDRKLANPSLIWNENSKDWTTPQPAAESTDILREQNIEKIARWIDNKYRTGYLHSNSIRYDCDPDSMQYWRELEDDINTGAIPDANPIQIRNYRSRGSHYLTVGEFRDLRVAMAIYRLSLQSHASKELARLASIADSDIDALKSFTVQEPK